jgi:hypothetical protein
MKVNLVNCDHCGCQEAVQISALQEKLVNNFHLKTYTQSFV